MRIVNSAQYHFSFMFNADGNTAQRNAMGKIYSAIDRVNDPFIIGILYNLAGFFA